MAYLVLHEIQRPLNRKQNIPKAHDAASEQLMSRGSFRKFSKPSESSKEEMNIGIGVKQKLRPRLQQTTEVTNQMALDI